MNFQPVASADIICTIIAESSKKKQNILKYGSGGENDDNGGENDDNDAGILLL